MSDIQPTIATFVRTHGVTMTAERTDSNPGMDDAKHPMDHWHCVLRMGRKRSTVVFSMGVGHHGKAPKAVDVLDCLLSDASGVENTRGFDDWCADYGYDTDSRKAESTFKACERSARKLRVFLGDLYDAAQSCERL